jgi:proteasome lid subunit RPN8/RPN11
MDLRVTRAAMTGMRAEASRAAPEECCGILLGHGARIEDAVPARNVHPTPRTHFEIDPQALIDAHRAARAGGPEVIGYYHSHPAGLAEPSATDRARAAHDGRVWAIVGENGVTFWRDDEHGFTPLSYSAEDR